ncbi:FecR domain-containing protein [Psychrosphaera haliotis]|uniref:FecR family protein n=1 Tax=Psychrosphaera haliotis TaxID=555083 RepID=UPI001E40C404|nr:FecR family protein [Psychrosphaera haliotis]
MRKLIFLSLVISTIYTPSLLAAENAGKTIMSRGDVQAFDARSQESRPLKRRAPIFSVDKVITKETGRAQFSMSDGGLLSIKPNSEVFISSYAYDPESKQGSAVIELVKGGLRSISGQIKKHGGDYQVKTPVGSIGIRGTHFELAMVNDDMFIAVWDGAIDLMSNDESTVSFGQDEAFSFGKVSMDGTITELLAPPSIFEQGHSTKVSSSNSEETSEPESVDESIVSVSEQQDLENVDSIITNSEVDNSIYSEQQFLVSSETTLADALATRTGSYTYETLEQAEVTSNLGSVS